MRNHVRKVRKMRGRRTHGYGKVGQHRKQDNVLGEERLLNGKKARKVIT